MNYLQGLFINANRLTWNDVLRTLLEWGPRDGCLRESFLSCRGIWVESQNVRIEVVVHVSPGDVTNLEVLIYIRWVGSWSKVYWGGRCGWCGPPKTMFLKDHLLPNTGLLTGSAGKLNTVSSVRIGDERGLLYCGGNIQDLWSMKIGVWKGYQLGKLI